MIRLYEEVLGLNNGDRPPFDVHGAWLYSGENPIVHLVEVSKHLETTGNIDHFALKAQEYEKMCEKLIALSIPFELLDVANTSVRQIFIKDPSGVKIELNFSEG